jgi:peroxiredoxin
MMCLAELGQLEAHQADFEKRNVRVIAISRDNLEDSQKTQAAFKHLQVVSDADHKVADALSIVDKGHGPGGSDTNAPTTILVDGTGTVRWIARPDRFVVRIAPEEVLKEVDQHLPAKGS